MFNNDVTQTYNHQDATLEIIIMLAGAFLLGCLLCWLIKNLLREAKHKVSYSSEQYQVQTLKDDKPSPQTTGTARIVKASNTQSESMYRTPRIDDLTKISGIDADIQIALKKEGINSYTDLRDIKRQTLKAIQDNDLSQYSNKKEIETWPHQSSLAAKGEWKKLKEYQSFIERAQIASQKTSQNKSEKTDDLKLVEGIGPKIEEILNNKGIHTFNQLSNADSISLKKYITDADERFNNNETESWPHQAGMAEKGQWDELNIYQEFMHSDSDSDSDSITTTKLASEGKEESNSHQKDHDDLKEIEGIGPKIEEVLNNSGIYTFRQLYNSDRSRLKKILNDAGNQFRMHDPESWPHQAGMADRGEWEELRVYQEFMDGGRETPSASASSKLKEVSEDTSNVISKKDDLKKIEGIGPKIEELLNTSGINSFKDLSNSSRDIIKKLLDDAGPQYRMHEPESWPHQAKLAYEGEWNKLDEYQDYLISGRE